MALGASGPALRAQPADVHPVLSGEWARSLNGTWQFRYAAGAAPEGTRPADTGAWAVIPVPSNWEMHGFAEPKYATTVEGYGEYRREFELPEAWRGQRVFLHFGGALYALEAWVNGQRVGGWASSFNPVDFDVTAAVRPGRNLLEVRVATRAKGWDFDLNDCWGLSGLYRDVTLFAVPAVHLRGYTSRTTLLADGTADLALTGALSGPGWLAGRLCAADGTEAAFVFEGKTPGELRATIRVPQAQLWSAETPQLYRLELQVEAPGQRSQTIVEKIGLREVSIHDGVLQLNGRPIKLRGVDHHDLWPDTGRATDEAKIRRDLELLRDGNCNFLRTSHYPPHSRLIELCDEMGIYVMDEVPFGFGDAHLKDPTFQEVLDTRARATLRRDRNRPSVIIWSVGNENPNTPLTFATGRLVKELDPTRPICFPQVGPYFTNTYREIPGWVDIYAPHYPDVATLRRYAQDLNRPVIVTEYAHGMGIQVDRIQDEWALMQAYPRLAGGALWMLQDQGLLRTGAPVDRTQRTAYAWRDATHYYDTNFNDGMDGMVYSDRTPQPDYREMRKVYSPVQLGLDSSAGTAAAGPVGLRVENRHDFISLTGFTLRWSWVRNGETLTRGEKPLRAPPRSQETVVVGLAPDGGSAIDADWLAVEVVNPAGRVLHERTFRRSAPDQAALVGVCAVPASEPLTVSTEGFLTTVRHARFALEVDRASGLVRLRDSGGGLLAEGPFAHAGRRFTESELLRLKNQLPMWSGVALAPEHPTVSIDLQEAQVVIRIAGRFVDPSGPQRALTGSCTLRVTRAGTIEMAYEFVPEAGNGGILLEAGGAWRLPVSCGDFRWLGTGPDAGYPGADALNEYGRHHLQRDDIRFQGNRRGVEVALLANAAGGGLLLIPGEPADVAVQRENDGLVVSHNALVSGRGTKQFAPPETIVRVEETPRIAGSFTLVPVGVEWPAAVQRLFGAPGVPPPSFEQPFYHSYDQ